MGSTPDVSAAQPISLPDDQPLLDALGSDALILQNKRSALTNEATNRSSLFVAIVSGSLVAAGFVLRSAYAFSFLVIVLPIVLVLGTVTFFRLATIARDDRRLDAQLEWIRTAFRGLSPRGPVYLLPERPVRGGDTVPARRVVAALTSAAGFVGILVASLLGLGVALVLGVLLHSPGSAASSIAGVLVSLAATAASVGWIVRATSSSWDGPAGTPLAPGERADRSRP